LDQERKNVAATVKWYRPEKGFGFIRLEDGAAEAFLHGSVLAPLGPVNLTEGTALVCDVIKGEKGLQVSAVHSVSPAPAAPAAPKRSGRRERQRSPEQAETGRTAPDTAAEYRTQHPIRRPRPAAPADAPMCRGTVRWYNLDSQSGIIDPEDGGLGVLFDRAILRKSGLDVVADGEDVWFIAHDDDDGPVAERVELA